MPLIAVDSGVGAARLSAEFLLARLPKAPVKYSLFQEASLSDPPTPPLRPLVIVPGNPCCHFKFRAS